MTRAVGYIRVSTEEQARTGLSLDVQREKLIAYAALYNLELVAIEQDDGASAKTLDRAGLRAALAMIDRGEAEGLLIAKLDRLSRSVRDWDQLITRYFGEKAGRQLWSVQDSIDTRTAGGRLVLNVLVPAAQWEREAIAERTRDSLRHKIRTGSRCGKVRFGSKINPDDPRRSKKKELPVGLEPEPAEVEAIALMKRLRENRLSYRKIAQALTDRKIPTRDGRDRWDHTSVRKILLRA